MTQKDLTAQYLRLFPSDREKAAAFDRIAKQYYFCNFGTMQKSDLEVLLFSEYLDRIQSQPENTPKDYSDYTLSKYLGITQARIRSLKVKKELIYPKSNADWRDSFRDLVNHARFENGKIKLFIPEDTLYLEIKNAIEESHGIVELQRNSKILQVAPLDFIDLMMSVSDEKDRNQIRKNLKKTLADKNIDTEFLEKPEPITSIKKNVGEIAITVVADIISDCIPGVGKYVGSLIRNSFKELTANSNQ